MAIFGKQRQENEGGYAPPHQLTSTTGSDTKPSAQRNSVVGKSIFIKGNIFSDEEVFIQGKIEGKLHSQHRVVIEKSGIVNADVEAREIIIKGTVNGNVTGSFKVEIIPEGVLNGNILSQRVKLADGAIFKGSIDMTTKENTDKRDEDR
jgi:cytoskeletal protein CcmA (bactofilin family)